MNILITDAELYLICKIETQKELGTKIKSIITTYAIEVGVDSSMIRNVIIDNLVFYCSYFRFWKSSDRRV